MRATLRSSPVIANLTGDVSQCKLTKLITVVNTLAVEDTILPALTTDREIDQYLSGDEFSAYQLVNLLYPEYKSRASAAELDELFEPLPVDMGIGRRRELLSVTTPLSCPSNLEFIR